MLGGVAVVGEAVEEEVGKLLVAAAFKQRRVKYNGMEVCLCRSIAGVRPRSGLLLFMEK